MISSPRATAIWNAWILGGVRVDEVEQIDLDLPFYSRGREWHTLRQAFLLTTTSCDLMIYLLKTGQGKIETILSHFMRRCVLLAYPIEKLRMIWKACGGSSEVLLQCPKQYYYYEGFCYSPLGTAIQHNEREIVELFIEWGCRLPLNVEIRSWAWQIQEDVCARKARCAEAIVAFHLACPRFGGWRDLCPIMERMIWNTRYQACWEAK